MHVKAPAGDHKIADLWEVTPHHVLSQLGNQPVFKIQSMNAENAENICVLHRNMFFPIQSAITTNNTKDDITNDTTNDSNFALMKANLLMDPYFDD